MHTDPGYLQHSGDLSGGPVSQGAELGKNHHSKGQYSFDEGQFPREHFVEEHQRAHSLSVSQGQSLDGHNVKDSSHPYVSHSSSKGTHSSSHLIKGGNSSPSSSHKGHNQKLLPLEVELSRPHPSLRHKHWERRLAHQHHLVNSDGNGIHSESSNHHHGHHSQSSNT
jgi:hypothetical protein